MFDNINTVICKSLKMVRVQKTLDGSYIIDTNGND